MINRRVLLGLTLLCSLLLFLGCGAKSTPQGEFKKFDLRAGLPPDIAAVSDEQAKEYVKEVSLGDASAKVLIRWRTFKKGDSAYILSGTVEVPEEIKGIQLTKAEILDRQNAGTDAVNIQTNPVVIYWVDSTTESRRQIYIKANGELF